MLELYHWEPVSNSGEVLILLKEKGIDFISHYVDLYAFGQHHPTFLKVSPQAQVPVVVHDGRVITETGFILQYIEAEFPTPHFLPKDPKDRYWVNVWIKYVEEYIAPAVSRLGMHKTAAEWRARATTQARAGLERAPLERQQAWAKALDTGYDADDLELARGLLPVRLERMEETLRASDWLAGEHYSLADIAVFPTAMALPLLTPDLVNATATPGVMAWLERVRSRPPVQAALAMARTPDLEQVFAPGPEGSRWG